MVYEENLCQLFILTILYLSLCYRSWPPLLFSYKILYLKNVYSYVRSLLLQLNYYTNTLILSSQVQNLCSTAVMSRIIFCIIHFYRLCVSCITVP